MRGEKKGKRSWFYISEEDEARLDKLAQATGLSPAFVMTTIATAAIRAVADNNYRLSLPLHFELSEASPVLNEPSPSYRNIKPKK